MRKIISILGLLFLLSPIAQAVDDQVVMIHSEDAEMNAAIARAQRTLDDFIRIKANPPKGASGFKLKVRITDPHGTEHMWVTPFKKTTHGFVGILADEPEIVRNVVNGQRITFTKEEISDWGYVLNGRQKGSFTVCVVFKHMPREQVQQYRDQYSFECYD